MKIASKLPVSIYKLVYNRNFFIEYALSESATEIETRDCLVSR